MKTTNQKLRYILRITFHQLPSSGSYTEPIQEPFASKAKALLMWESIKDHTVSSAWVFDEITGGRTILQGYSLKCPHYGKVFNTEDELMQDVLESGQDPSYLVTKDGKSQGYKLSSILQP